jgi:hypothetical protein
MAVKRLLAVFVLGIAFLAVSTEIVSAQAIVRAVYRVALTDPASGAVFYSDRQSIRSWPSEEQCEREKDSFSGFHINALRNMNITNAGGTPLTVSMDSSYCLIIRQ